MSIRRKVLAVLGSMHQRLVGVEDDAERNGASLNRIEKALARIETEGLARIERAVVEQGKTLGTALEGWREESSRRGEELGEQKTKLLNHESRLMRLEKAGANGAE